MAFEHQNNQCNIMVFSNWINNRPYIIEIRFTNVSVPRAILLFTSSTDIKYCRNLYS